MSDPWQYTVGWICATTRAYTAACQLLDEEHDGPDHVAASDDSYYSFGKILGHHVVIAVPPEGEYRLSSAGAVIKTMLHSFLNIRVGLWISIDGGGVSIEKNDTQLGNIIVSSRYREVGNVDQYNYSNIIRGRGLKQIGFFDQPPMVVHAAINDSPGVYGLDGSPTEANVIVPLDKKPVILSTSQESSIAQGSEHTCRELFESQTANLIRRVETEKGEEDPVMNSAGFASANQLMRIATMRDTIAEEQGIVCFEMEAAGLTSDFPCLVVKGISAYSDSHKNRKWEAHAVETAAKYTRELLKGMRPGAIEQQNLTREAYVDASALQHPENLSRSAEWLAAPNLSTNRTDSPRQHHDSTDLWFVHRDTFKKWKRQSDSSYWLHSMPVYSKTIPSHAIREHLNQDAICQILSDFYFAFENTDADSLSIVLRSLVDRFHHKRLDDSQSLYYSWASHIKGNRDGSTKLVQSAIRSALWAFSNVKIVMDTYQIASETDHGSAARSFLDSAANAMTVGPPARASKPQEGLSNVAYSGFHSPGYSSRQIQTTVDEYESEVSQLVDDDLGSVRIAKTDIQSYTESQATSIVREADEYLIPTDRQVISPSEHKHPLPTPLETKRDLFGILPWRKPSEYLKTRTYAICLDVWKQGMSRIHEIPVWSGLLLGPLQPGYTRITWKSNMGHKHISDVKQLKTGGINKVFGNLERSRGIKIVSMGNTTNTAGNSVWASLINKVIQWTSKKAQKPPILPQQTPAAFPTAQPQRRRLSHTQAGDILMICMQGGKRSKNIYQEDLYVRNVDNDQALFVFLQQMFVTHRGALRSYLSLRTIKELKLVEFRLPKNRRPFIPYVSCPSNTCRCLPPEDRILPVGAEYRCTSSGGGGDICPPVPAHVLTDYYENPGSIDATDTWLLELMPKRVCGQLEGTSTEPAQGWGISYEEGWDHEKIGLVLLVVFFGGSLLFGVFWTVFKNDIQGAFGVSAWWLGASTILLGYVAIRADDS